MEATDNKGPEAIAIPNLSPKEELKTSPKQKAGSSGKVSVDNGSVNGEAEKKAEVEKDSFINTKEENSKTPPSAIKPTEPAGVKQSNIKPAESTNKKSSREEKYSRRKDERSVEQVMRALNSFESPQEKLEALVKKYAEVADENRKLQTQTKNMERRLIQVEREKDSAQSEHSKAVLARSRLEGLCRELQRQNRAIKEESVLKIREEEEKRKEVSNKFQSTLAEITSLMQQNNEKNSKLRDDNIEMTTKFKSVCEQYELRVQQVEKISKQMQLEAQLADAKLAKSQLEAKAEKEHLLRDKQELLMELAQYQVRAREQQETELRLREQVELYSNKYDEFQTALSRSNEVFGGFKEEMERMSKKIVKLEKETSTWKQRWEKSHQALLEMATDKQQRDAELALANRQLNQLHKLCRTLTEERAKLMAQINTLGEPSDAAKEEKLAADIAEDRRKLNDTLDSLQSVILERELLHKQQQLEKQQQQLQAELQKHVSASGTAESKLKSNDAGSVDEPKTTDSKPSEAKSAGNKHSESNKKKGKNKKAGRQPTEKQANHEEAPQENESLSCPVNPPPINTLSEPMKSSGDTCIEAKSVSNVSVSPSLPEKTDAEKIEEETKITVSQKSPDKVSLPVSEPVPPPAVVPFSYAAAVGSKPTEHTESAAPEKSPPDESLNKSAVSGNESTPPAESSDSLSTGNKGTDCPSKSTTAEATSLALVSEPAAAPAPAPAPAPVAAPAAAPNAVATAAPLEVPSAGLTVTPAAVPAGAPSAARAVAPKAAPSVAPTATPIVAPAPSAAPVDAPVAAPTTTSPNVAPPNASPSSKKSKESNKKKKNK
ncbi:Alpha-taxilin [Frankliniella fusca]|uniref:Alpha-taxilin n=1 Tax=Frankliniella fusca TaxID=407009 RepID=A0AAE1I3W9_9NEOP|nr:Alpha-taxilin [Frankliniella fusca]